LAPLLAAYCLLLTDNGPQTGSARNSIATGPDLFHKFASMKTSLCLSLALACVFLAPAQLPAANPAGFGPEAAREQLKQLKVADGLSVGLYASEPMIRNPISMDIDARGRVWVTEGANYRLFQKWGKLRAEGDRIVILEDTNHDGAADNAKVFYQGNDVNSALGICVLGDRVIVSCSPNILIFEDKNGDDVADGPPKILFSGIGGVDHDHGAHAFQFGPDGKLYFNIGNDGKQLKTADGRDFVVDQAGNKVNGDRQPYQQGLVFRCNPDGSELETLGWNFRNNFEVAVDSFGTLWQSDNDDDGNQAVRINYVMEFGNYGYKDEKTGAAWNQKRTNMEKEIPLQHWHLNDPGVVPNLLQTGAGSPTGIIVYEGALLPAVFRNQMIHCDAGPRVVRAYPVRNSGAGYSATIVDVLTSDDTWYRPSDVTVAPDGSLYVSDWNDAGVGGHYMADQKYEEMTGRIYRVAPPGHQPVVPAVDLKTAQGAVAALQSPNNATRHLAWTALHGMGKQAEGELQKLWNGQDARQRARALHLLARIKGEEGKYVKAALRDQNSDIRITGLRIARERGLETIPLVRQLVNDPSPQVRRECAIALRHSQSPEAPGLWATLAQQHDGQDRWYLEALGIAADKNEDAFFNAWFAAVGDRWNTPAGRDLIWRSRAKKCPELLVRILSDPATPEEAKPRYLRALDFLEGPEKEKALVDLLTANLN
jgi:putative membrane-bound dehydrogenase-like protein